MLNYETRRALKQRVSEARHEIAMKHRRVENELERRVRHGPRVGKRPTAELACGIDGCQFSTNYANALVNHQKHKHKKAESVTSVQDEIAEVKKQLDEIADDDRIPCDVEGCNYRARNATGLGVHKARTHSIRSADQVQREQAKERKLEKLQDGNWSLREHLEQLEAQLSNRRRLTSEIEEQETKLADLYKQRATTTEEIAAHRDEIARKLEIIE